MVTRRNRKTTAASAGGWQLVLTTKTKARRSQSAGGERILESLAATGRIEVDQSWTATLSARRGIEDQPLVVDVKPGDDGLYAGYCLHASGAITFHAPEEPTGRRGTRPAIRTLRFRITTQSRPPALSRRSFVGKVVKFVLLKILGKVLDVALDKLARIWEERTWRKNKTPRGLLRICQDQQGKLSLEPIADPEKLAAGPCLLFIHGTFSNFLSAFGELATTRDNLGRTLFDAVRDQYGERILAFNHFSVSETPLENAQQLLGALPVVGCDFDVITHSRGGLVLRSLDELRGSLGPASSRFRLRRAVLVASPNQGTPLASPERWETVTNWMANLLDLLPNNPFIYALEFVAESVGWLASRAGGVIPGLAAMNPNGPLVAQIQALPGSTGLLSALAANFEPNASWLARAADVGIDNFFEMENDLVVPTEGGWLVGGRDVVPIPSERIGVFGPDGNLGAANAEVHHCNFFNQPASVSFITDALRGASAIANTDPTITLSATRSHRRFSALQREPTISAPDATPVPSGQVAFTSNVGGQSLPLSTLPYALDEILNLFILVPEVAGVEISEAEHGSPDFNARDFARSLASSTKSQTALMIASFRNARVYVPFRTSSGSAGDRWHRLIAMHKRIKGYVDGSPRHTALPSDAEMRDFGALLFDTLFPGQVRRLYDAARAELRDRRLDVCLTSTIGWVADMPWEFAFDPSRQMFLCMEEVNFLRNVSTAVPADSITSRSSPLRILVIAAQPIGAGALSIQEEEAVIKRAFQPMIDACLAEVDVIAGVTPQLLHEVLSIAEVEQRAYDVLHFIGHGEFDTETGFGSLLFEDADGRCYDLRADHFRQIVARRGIRLVFLNACETGMGFGGSRRLDFAQGVAPMLVAGGVPAVVANQFKVLDPSAAAFAQHFYWALATGRTIGDAAREARVAVNYSIAGEAIDWAVPVLFARNPGDRLIATTTRPQAADRAITRQAKAARRRRRATHRRRVAILDVNYVIPTLPQIIERLNTVQTQFEFETADVPTPLGTWRRAMEGDDGETYFLYAEDVEAKLQSARLRLGVAHLVCVTNLPLADDETMNLTTHVTEGGDISIVSTADSLGSLDPPTLSIQRLVCNYVAFALSGLTAHKKTPKDCISYYNGECDIKYMAGKNRLCGACQNKLLSAEIAEALSAIINAWD